MRRLVVIGGDAAGMSAASQARRRAPADQLEIVAFERGPRTSYAACGLPYLLAGDVARASDLVARTPDEHRSRGIDARVLHEVQGIDVSERTVTVTDLASGRTAVEPWDELLIATGAVGVRPPLPGIDAGGIHEVRSIDDAVAVEAALAEGARRAVVVGAGYIGLEVAEALVARGLEVAVVEMAEHCMGATLDASMARRVDEAVRAAGVALHLGSPVGGFEATAGRVRAVATADGTIPADLVVLGLGVRPRVELATAAGIPVGEVGGIVVDDRMHTPVEGVWAAGDCVESRHRVSGRAAVVALGTHANKQGRVVGTNVTGGDATFGGVLGTAITRFGELEIGRTGLTLAEAERLGIPAVASETRASTRPHYMPDASVVDLLLVVDPSGGRLLGAQVVGGPGAGKRIDVLATALWNGMTVAELADADLSYAPPFSPVFDPVALAAGRAAVALGMT